MARWAALGLYGIVLAPIAFVFISLSYSIAMSLGLALWHRVPAPLALLFPYALVWAAAGALLYKGAQKIGAMYRREAPADWGFPLKVLGLLLGALALLLMMTQSLWTPLLDQWKGRRRVAARLSAVQDLEKLPPEARGPLAGELAALLKDPDRHTRAGAAYYLTQTRHAQALPGLIEALRDEDHMTRVWSLSALQALGPESEPAIPELLAYLGRHPSIPSPAAGALAKAGPAGFAALLEALQNEDMFISGAAAFEFKKMGPAAAQALPALRERAQKAESSRKNDYLQAIAAIEGPPPPNGR